MRSRVAATGSLLVRTGLLLMIALMTSAHTCKPFLLPARDPATEVTFADFDADGRGDLAVRSLASGDIAVRLNAGSHFGVSPAIVATAQAKPASWGDALFADMNGDGRADLINRQKTTGTLLVHFNHGTAFSENEDVTISGMSPTNDGWVTLFADFNDDGYADLCNVNLMQGTVFVHYNRSLGFSATADVVQAGLAVPSSPFSGWEHAVFDVDRDGRADFINVDLASVRFNVHRNLGQTFETVPSAVLSGPREVYEFNYSLAEMGGVAEAGIGLLQHNLRLGTILGYPLLRSSTGALQLGQRAVIRDDVAHYARPYRDKDVVTHETRSLDAVMFYDIDHLPELDGTFVMPDPVTGQLAAFPQGGWLPLNPNYPGGDAPNVGGPAGPNARYRTQQPLLGLYRSSNPDVIRQHAYWMAALGINAVVLDWTNVGSSNNPPNFADAIKSTTQTILETYESITDFVPPRVFIVTRYLPDRQSFVQDLHAYIFNALYLPHRRLWYSFYDGAQFSDDAPFLLILLGSASELSNVDRPSHPIDAFTFFNKRYTAGWLMGNSRLGAPPSVCGGTSADVPCEPCRADASKHTTCLAWGTQDDTTNPAERITNDLPYWNYVENKAACGRPGYYRALYRRLPLADGSFALEQSAMWAAVYLGDFSPFQCPPSTEWDGMFHVVAGEWPLRRTGDTLLKHPPRIALVNRFNYPIGWAAQPQEGMSLSGSVMIEPVQTWDPQHPEYSFAIFDATADLVHSLRALAKRPPGKPVIQSVAGRVVSFSSSGYPTSYRIGAVSGSGSWQYLDVNRSVVELPAEVPSAPFWLQTKNAFGESDPTSYP